MKKISIFISVSSLFFGVILIGILAWYGYFSTVSVKEKPVGPYVMVYKLYVGAPAEVGSVLDEIKQSLTDDFKMTSLLDFGLYYDEPKSVPAEECRTLIGCIITNDLDGDLQAIAEKYTVATLPRAMAVVADYPYRNKLSVLFGMLKGYSALFDYAEEHQIARKPVLEIYDSSRGHIRYILSIDLGIEFFDAYLTVK